LARTPPAHPNRPSNITALERSKRRLPLDVQNEIDELLRKTQAPASSDEVLLCACLFAVARRRPECHMSALRVSKNRSKTQYGEVGTPNYWMAAELHGLSYKRATDEPKIEKTYKVGRQASQQVHEIVKHTLLGLEKNVSSLPSSAREQAHEAIRILRDLSSLVIPTMDILKRKRSRALEESFTVKSLTLVWWRYCLYAQEKSNSKEHWHMLWQLARKWGLTDCKNENSFQSRIQRLTAKRTSIPTPPPWCHL
jgi:hypothetical protein